MIKKELLLIEIKETTEILNSKDIVVKLIEEKYNLKIKNLLSLDFLEDEFTDELVWHLYDKKSKKIYYCVYNPTTNEISLKEINDSKYIKENCFTFSVIDDYLNLSDEEISLLR